MDTAKELFTRVMTDVVRSGEDRTREIPVQARLPEQKRGREVASHDSPVDDPASHFPAES